MSFNYRRVVEIHAPSTKKGGTGYLIRNNLILTAHHITDSNKSISTVLCDIRFIGDTHGKKTEWLDEAVSLCGIVQNTI